MGSRCISEADKHLGVGIYADLGEGARRAAPAARVFTPRAEATEAYAALAPAVERVSAGLDPAWELLARWRAGGGVKM